MYPYLLYIAGVALLTLPSGPFSRERLKGASLAQLAERSRLRFDWLHVFNGIDLLRAYAGVILLSAAFAAIVPFGSQHLTARMTVGGIALLGLLMQHGFHRTERDELPAPVAYAVGLVFAFLPPHITLLALPLGIVLAIVTQNLGGGLILASVSVAALGLLFRVSIPTVGTASLVLFLPALLAGLLKRRLVLTIRRGQPVRYRSLRDVPLPAAR